MGLSRVPDGSRKEVLGLVSIPLFIFLITSPLAGQATTGWNPTPSSPASTWSPGSTTPPQVANPLVVDMAKEAGRYTAPNPYIAPTQQQTQWYVNNHPVLWSLPSSAKNAIIFARPGSGPLNGPYLPDGRTNPFYQNGKVTPNWYLPSTWSSPVTNWQGVQANGFLSTTTANAYN